MNIYFLSVTFKKPKHYYRLLYGRNINIQNRNFISLKLVQFLVTLHTYTTIYIVVDKPWHIYSKWTLYTQGSELLPIQKSKHTYLPYHAIT